MIASYNLSQNQSSVMETAAAHLVRESLEKENSALYADYEPDKKRIVIIGTSDLPRTALERIIYNPKVEKQFDAIQKYPMVMMKRSKDSNLVVTFCDQKPIMRCHKKLKAIPEEE